MKKEDYLAVLEEKLASLPENEASEKIRYYADYFDEFGDDENAALSLGNPEELARSILADKEVQVRSSEKTYLELSSDKLYWEFPSSCVKNLSLHLGSLNALIIPGSNYSVETRGLSGEEIHCFVDKTGTLTIQNTKVIPGLSYFSHSHERNRHFYPRVLITVPENAEIYSFFVGIGAGILKSDKIDIKYQKGFFQVFAGNVELSRLIGEKNIIRCAFGRISLDGRFPENTDVDNFLGKVSINTETKKENCSLESHSILGKIGWDDEKIDILGTKKIDGTGGNRFSINGVLAYTAVTFNK